MGKIQDITFITQAKSSCCEHSQALPLCLPAKTGKKKGKVLENRQGQVTGNDLFDYAAEEIRWTFRMDFEFCTLRGKF